MKDFVWIFGYNSCIHESSMAAISLHRTKKGAEIAMEHHKNEAKKEFEEMGKLRKVKYKDWGIKFGTHEAWDVYKREILD